MPPSSVGQRRPRTLPFRPRVERAHKVSMNPTNANPCSIDHTHFAATRVHYRESDDWVVVKLGALYFVWDWRPSRLVSRGMSLERFRTYCARRYPDIDIDAALARADEDGSSDPSGIPADVLIRVHGGGPGRC
jgi:hypothetical protein